MPLYSLLFQKSKKVYSPPEELQGFGDQSFPSLLGTTFTCFKTAFSFPVLVTGDRYRAGSKT